jgi:hypothetical protein
VAIWAVLIPASGGYFEDDWAPAAVATLGVLCVVVVGGRALVPRRPVGIAALALVLALLALSYASIAWAAAPGNAWQSANQLVVTVATAWILVLVPWSARSAGALLTVWSVMTAALCLADFLSALGVSDAGPLFTESRFVGPLGYPNASAALAAMAVPPLVALSALPRVPVLLSAAGVGVATLLVELALIPQTRSAVLGLLVATAVLFALVPNRFRLLGRVAIVAGAVVIAAPAILDIATAVAASRPVIPELHSAGRAMALTVPAAMLATLLLASLERRVPVERLVRPARTGARGMAAAVLAVALVAGVANRERLRHQASEQWTQFKAGTGTDTQGPRLFASGAFQRYDYWRVAVDAFADAPFAGIGAGNFERRYTAERKFAKHSRFAHSIWFRLIAEYGVLGIVLSVALAICLVGGCLALWRRAGPGERAVIASSLAVCAYFLFHASLDWLDEFPVLAAPALGFPLMVLALGTVPRPRLGGRLSGVVQVAAFAAGAAALTVSLALPLMAGRLVERARAERGDRAAAFRDLDRAADLDPLSLEPLLTKGFIALDLDDRAEARAAFTSALDREDHWVPHFELALLAAAEGRYAAADRELAAAARLDAMDPVIATAAERIRRRQPIDPAAINRSALQGTLYERRRLQ